MMNFFLLPHMPTRLPLWFILFLWISIGCTPLFSPQGIEPSAGMASDSSSQLDQPLWKIGDSWMYDDGYALVVTEVDDETTLFVRQDEENRWIKRRGFLTVASQEENKVRTLVSISPDPSIFFPLTVGKSETFTKRYQLDGQEREHKLTWLVEGQEEITVPAGKFNSWVILFTARSTRSDWQSIERWWYVPEIRYYVRLDYQYGNSPMESRHLLTFKPGLSSRTTLPGQLLQPQPPVTQESCFISREELSLHNNKAIAWDNIEEPHLPITPPPLTLSASDQLWAERLVEQWAKTWLNKDVVHNLAMYGKTFTPETNQSLSQWRNTRRANLNISDPIQVTTKNVLVHQLDNEQFEIIFFRIYKSSTQSNEAYKRWIVSREQAGDFILKEETWMKAY
ncbi:MAG: hypothetical protein H7832_09515 [Magnetococcus sp. DMHC-6]